MKDKINLEKPKIKLNPLEKTAVNTQTQKEYNELMQVYEIGGWKWRTGYLPTELELWKTYKEKTCIGGGIGTFANKGRFGYCDEEFYKKESWKILSSKEFYKKQKITPEMIKEINKYFENNFPNRANKGK